MRTAGLWPPLMVTRPTPLSCAIFGESRVSTRSSTWGSGMEFGSNRQRQHRRVGGVGLAINRRRGKIGGQEALRGIDRRLHLFLRHVDIQAQGELQHHHRGAGGAVGSHLVQARHLSELPLERRGYRRRDDIGTGARIISDYLDGGVIDLRQRGDRELREGDRARPGRSRPSAAKSRPAAG